ncbi:EAL domain-containing protein [Gilvimarinus sp. SDUM040013]|uniref:EAL domain-containing protein n=1 Tax=Gilvimarinus gilvus TaxID=3058038 RepID=A0ABU4RX73_9GAMM|nr:EAL domain-containing protein [Gilvimarinus sp. SDUM040013]MDO3387733.1 EAL domain-containing protein [Gilvimarinus sp. SDUM040013]MDX6848826.1 EAL domain-containing protein [Gilvimarinus sp. SDUM040013]
MTIDLFQRLSYKLARTSFVVVVVLGVLVASLQVYLDFRTQYREILSNVDEISRVSRTSAQRAVFLLDESLAEQVVQGLAEYRFLSHIAIFDDQNQLMAQYRQNVNPSQTLWLTRLLVGEKETFDYSLVSNGDLVVGTLSLELNKDRALNPFYHRAWRVLLTGTARNIGIALVLVMVYHFLLTRPLVNLATRFAALDHAQVPVRDIAHLRKHEHDELGYIVNSANRLLSNFNEKHAELQHQQQQLSLILDASPNQVFAVDFDGNMLFFNQAFKRYFGTDNIDNYYALLESCNIKESSQIRSLIQRVCKKQSPVFNRQQHFSGIHNESHVMQMSLVPFVSEHVTRVIVVLNNITELVEAEERVEYLAYCDTLTGLANRNKILEQLQEDIHRCKSSNTYGALLLIDLNDFKRINDTMGHSLGDELLLRLSQRMAMRVREPETLARLGGDEFILSMPEIGSNLEQVRLRAEHVAERFLQTINQPVTLANQDFAVQATVGIALYPVNDSTVESLLSQADTALNEAKRRAHGSLQVFEPKMAAEVNRLLQLESDIRSSYQEHRFTFHLQPLIDLHARSLVGAEALIRWNHPMRGVVSPYEFIGFLENSEMINPVGMQLLDDVCQFIRSHKEQGRFPPEMRIAVNISERQIYDADFVGKCLSVLQKYKLPGSCLEFEITEGAALHNLDEVVDKMRKLQNEGITFALDDFGTGYSSLSYLKRLPVNKVKIDKSFIDDITIDPQDAAMVASIIAIARNMNLLIVAEGVETDAQAQWLSQYDDILIQGYLFDKPLQPEVFSQNYLPKPPAY